MGAVLSVIIIGLVLLTIALFILVIIKTGNPPAPPTPPNLPSPVGFGIECKKYVCDKGLTCDTIYSICKSAPGSMCSIGLDCATGSYCSDTGLINVPGICVVIPPSIVTNQPNDPCPCPTTMSCVTDAQYSYPVCKLNPGQTCTNNTECLSNICSGGVCTSGVPGGGICYKNSDCVTGLYCSSNYCQPNGVVTGESGSYCDLSGCNTGLSCVNGICISSSSGLGQSCSDDNRCSQPLVCLGSGTAAYCGYMYPEPNSCNGNACTSQYTCISDICLADVTLPCTSNTHCGKSGSGIQGTCNLSNVIYRLLFKSSSGTFTDPFGSPGSYEIILEPISNSAFDNFIGDFQVSKLTGFNNDLVGNQVYVVILGTGVISSDGSILIQGRIAPSSSNPRSRILIDADIYDTKTGYVAFIETDGTNTYNTLYFFNGGFLTPFNPTNLGPGFPGTQYTNDSTPQILSINSISVNINGDLLIYDSSYVCYVLPKGETTWQQLLNSSTEQPLGEVDIPKFYNGGSSGPGITNSLCTSVCPSYLNVSYVNPINNQQLLQFNGTIQGGVYPRDSLGSQTYNVVDYSIYSDPVNGLQQGYLSIVAQVNLSDEYNLFMGVGGSLYKIPGYMNENTKVLNILGGSYVYNNLACLIK